TDLEGREERLARAEVVGEEDPPAGAQELGQLAARQRLARVNDDDRVIGRERADVEPRGGGDLRAALARDLHERGDRAPGTSLQGEVAIGALGPSAAGAREGQRDTEDD